MTNIQSISQQKCLLFTGGASQASVTLFLPGFQKFSYSEVRYRQTDKEQRTGQMTGQRKGQRTGEMTGQVTRQRAGEKYLKKYIYINKEEEKV